MIDMLKYLWFLFFGPDVEDVIDRHFLWFHSNHPFLADVSAAQKTIVVTFPCVDLGMELPEEIEGCPVVKSYLIVAGWIPDIRRKTDEDRLAELEEKVNLRAAKRAGLLNEDGTVPETSQMTYGELEKYYYFLHRIWGIE